MSLGLDGIAQRLEHPPQEPLTAPDGNDMHPGRERDRGRRQFGPVIAAALERRAINLRDRHTQERRGDVGSIVDILGEKALGRSLATHDPHRVHVEQQARRTAIVGHLGVEDVRPTEAQVVALEPRGVLVQQVTEVGGGSESS